MRWKQMLPEEETRDGKVISRNGTTITGITEISEEGNLLDEKQHTSSLKKRANRIFIKS